MELRPQDLLVVLKAAASPARWTYAALGEAVGLSPSQCHRSVARAEASGLVVVRGRGDWAPVATAILEFAVHGVRYVWPAVGGPSKRGVPTSYGAEPLSKHISAAEGEAPVWAHPTGTARGPSLSPLYRTAPQAALRDASLHRMLSLLDALRTGRARERTIAADLLRTELKVSDARF